ncbi:hypothetical protein F4818DRAFT_395435 [Hypoxylon cercidicola]|nr:hypothetical protein F4818DRAFT_395435 [Hypoxylon cercidicola]
MHTVYRQAKQVWVWLGRGSEYNKDAIALLPLIAKTGHCGIRTYWRISSRCSALMKVSRCFGADEDAEFCNSRKSRWISGSDSLAFDMKRGCVFNVLSMQDIGYQVRGRNYFRSPWHHRPYRTARCSSNHRLRVLFQSSTTPIEADRDFDGVWARRQAYWWVLGDLRHGRVNTDCVTADIGTFHEKMSSRVGARTGLGPA